MEKRDELYAGKAKSVFTTDDPERLVIVFRNDTSAFDGKKKEALDRKGAVNNQFNAAIMEMLHEAGIPTHFEKLLSANESLVKKLDMIPVECVVRNIAAGSIVRRLGVEEGKELNPPTFELFLKDDALGDPMINEYHVRSFGWAEPEHIEKMKELTFKVNDVLKKRFWTPTCCWWTTSWNSACSTARWCSVTSSPRTVAGCGTRTPARRWTRTASARTWAT
jgi:phosphoribosylaminoimidazole-succinocarboxamide synthase